MSNINLLLFDITVRLDRIEKKITGDNIPMDIIENNYDTMFLDIINRLDRIEKKINNDEIIPMDVDKN